MLGASGEASGGVVAPLVTRTQSAVTLARYQFDASRPRRCGAVETWIWE